MDQEHIHAMLEAWQQLAEVLKYFMVPELWAVLLILYEDLILSYREGEPQ